MEISEDTITSEYDAESVPFENYTLSTVLCADLDSSAGNVSLNTLEVYQLDDLEIDEQEFNYRGPKVLHKTKIRQLFAQQILLELFEAASFLASY